MRHVAEVAREQIAAGRDREILRRLLFLAEALVVRVEEQLAAHDRSADAAAELIAVQIGTGTARALVEERVRREVASCGCTRTRCP